MAPAQEMMLSAMIDRFLNHLLMTDSRPSGQPICPQWLSIHSQSGIVSGDPSAELHSGSFSVQYGSIFSSIKIYSTFLPPESWKRESSELRLIVRGSGLGFGTHTADDRQAVSLDCPSLGSVVLETGSAQKYRWPKAAGWWQGQEIYLKP